MGKIEEFLTAIEPLMFIKVKTPERSHILRPFIKFLVMQDAVKAGFSPFGSGGRVGISLYSELNKPPVVYFSVSSFHTFNAMKIPQDPQKKNDAIRFSVRDVFQFLNLGDPFEKSPDGSLEDLHNLCLRIKENWQIIDAAFSDENIEKTYTALTAMSRNN